MLKIIATALSTTQSATEKTRTFFDRSTYYGSNFSPTQSFNIWNIHKILGSKYNNLIILQIFIRISHL